MLHMCEKITLCHMSLCSRLLLNLLLNKVHKHGREAARSDGRYMFHQMLKADITSQISKLKREVTAGQENLSQEV